jgi:hypothetical protein
LHWKIIAILTSLHDTQFLFSDALIPSPDSLWLLRRLLLL